MRIPPRFRVVWLALGLLAGLLGVTASAEQYILGVPGRQDLTSTARVDRQQLVITDGQNQTFIYQRMPRLDTSDGRYLGFYSQAAGQTLRWPANNAGSMLIGDAAGQRWRQSEQQIQPLAGGGLRQPNNIVTRRPAFDQFDRRGPVDPRGLNNQFGQQNVRQQQQPYSGPMEVAYTPAGERALDVGYIGPQGDLQLYRGWRDQWQPHQIATLQSQAGLLPGAPLRLVSREGRQLPSAYTVNSGGQLVEIVNGNQVRAVADNVQFAPRSNLHVTSTQQGPIGYAVDAQGRLWNLDIAGGRHQLIDQSTDRFSPGAPISVVTQPLGGRGFQENLYLVDRTGRIVNYSQQGGQWGGPQVVAAGFPPGAPLAAAVFPEGQRNQIRLAGVDVRGHVQTLGMTGVGWQTLPVQGAILPPGSPLAFTQLGTTWSLSGVGPGGVWNEWDYVSGRWNPSVIARGFLSGSPIVADPYLQTAFGVDATGRLVAGGYWDNAWHSHLLVPGLDYATPLVERTIVGAQNLPPATVYFDNSTPEELVVQMVDPFAGRPIQFNIPPGGSVTQQIPRQGAGTLQEVYLVPGPFGEWVERVDTFPMPPQPGPTVVAWSKRVTYTYIDPKGISVVPDFDLKNNVSLGVFELPPGDYLRDGDRIDVFAEAASRRNPGAAQFFGMPAPDADVGVPLIRNYEQSQPQYQQPQYQQPQSQQPQYQQPRSPSGQRQERRIPQPGTGSERSPMTPTPPPPPDSQQPAQEDSRKPDQGPYIPPLPE